MKFSLEWLRHFLATDASVAEIAAALNRIGHEVEGIEDPAERFDGFRIAEVLSAAPHPNADKLQVLSVVAGPEVNGGEPLQIVCGAPNARAGMKGVLGLPGAVVPANGMELRKSAIRGVESNGMMCSVRELELGDEHDGIIELPADAPVGTNFADYGETSPVFDVAITPNRPDCMGVLGIARDLAAAGIGTLKPLAAPTVEGEGPCPVELRIEDHAGCPAFFGRVVRGVDNTAPSPEWMQRRLKAAGQRPISALVDITNYLMLAFGRPAHAYDLAKLTGPVTARRARDGEEAEALNGKTYTLDGEMTVIADHAGVHDIGGIMGGEHSGCSETTQDVLLEIAYFDPEHIARTGQKLGLASDARSRFERGVDPAFLDDGLAILTDLILRICGGSASEVIRVGSAPTRQVLIDYQPTLTETLGGVPIGWGEQRRILEALGFVIDNFKIMAPSWRPDIAGAADLVEEVVRIYGLESVHSAPLPRVEGVARPTATPLQLAERKLRRTAAGRGLNEAVTWSFLPLPAATHFAEPDQPLWVLENPISEDMKAMRPSLIPGLLAAAKRNADRGAAGARLFEIGRRYFRKPDGASDERATLGLLLAGQKSPRGWAQGKANGFDAYDAKAEVLALLEAAGAPVERLMVMGPDAIGPGPQFHPGQSATLRLGPKLVLARFGALHPATLKAFDIEGPVMAGEIYFDAIPERRSAGFARAAYAPPALQRVTRDFAFLVDADLAAGELERAALGANKALIVAARVFDVFAGSGVPEGRKSLAIEVVLQPNDKSFTEAEIKAVSDAVVAAIGKLGGELRG